MSELRFTSHEIKIVNYLQAHPIIALEELKQFAKDPQNVKIKTLQKTISEIKKKYVKAGVNVPFKLPTKQNIVLLKRDKPEVVQPYVPLAHQDFKLDMLTKQVRTKNGPFQLNDNEWDMMKYLHFNTGKLITQSELRDKVVFPQFGSKTPARWFDAVGRIINNLRRQVVGLRSRLLTVKGAEETAYLFQ